MNQQAETFRKPLKRPSVIVVIAVLQFLLGTGGFYGGYMLLSDISGKKLGVPPDLLAWLPISTYLIPGLILVIFMGVLPFTSVIGILRPRTIRSLERANLMKKYYWPFSWTLFNACFLIGWTVGELILWDVNFLSVLYLIWGLFTLMLCLLPKTREYYIKPVIDTKEDPTL